MKTTINKIEVHEHVLYHINGGNANNLKEYWEKHYKRELSEDELNQIIDNLINYFSLLVELKNELEKGGDK